MLRPALAHLGIRTTSVLHVIDAASPLLAEQQIGAMAQAGKTVVMVIDHADRLSEEVIVEVARLHKYLDVPPDAVIRVFVGSLDLASRIDMVLRRIGADQRLADIRLSQPTAEDVATILAYDDSARSGGPMLTAQAIERISAYAKSNLHWAVPMADAARSLAEMEGAREVTPELVREALLDIWSPEHEAPDDPAIPPARFGLGAGVPGVAGSQPSSGLSDSMGFPAVITEPAPRANSSRRASAARLDAKPAKPAQCATASPAP